MLAPWGIPGFTFNLTQNFSGLAYREKWYQWDAINTSHKPLLQAEAAAAADPASSQPTEPRTSAKDAERIRGHGVDMAIAEPAKPG